jgi:heme exporter protein C
VQRLFYLHVPAFSGAFVAFVGTVIGGIMYLRTRQVKWDTLALAGVEVGLAMSLVNVALGSIWARPIWNTWWTWDPRLTWSAISILTYFAYLMLRNGIENPEQRRRFAAVYGILAIVTVIIVLIIPRVVTSTIHPVVLAAGIGSSSQNSMGSFDMADRQKVAIGVNSLIYSVLVPIPLLWHRIRLQNLSERVNAAKARLLEQ